ncbi:MAG: response regulator [Bryobacteraceae bacterium]
MTVLIVEDNEPMRRMIRSVVAGFANDIRECSDGAEAVAACRSFPVDCVLMDIKLPRVDGITTARALRTMNPEARIVIVTSYDDDDLRKAAAAAGCCAYVLKSNLLPLRSLLSKK